MREQKNLGGAPIVLQPEAERLVEDLKPIRLEDVGSVSWTKYHQILEKLNMQAQLSVMHQSDEYVVEALIDHEKISLLIHDLIVTEVWKERVLPVVIDDLAATHFVKLYLIIYHESVVLGLLEKAFYHSSAVQAGGELLLELADYCYRRAVLLNHELAGGGAADDVKKEEDKVDATELDRLREQSKAVEFTCACSALTLVRFMTDNVKGMPLGVLSRMLADQDLIHALVPLLDSPPWKRTIKGKTEIFTDGRWVEQDKSDTHRLSKMDAQVWLALNNLLLAPECRAKYQWDEYKKQSVMRLSKYFNEILIDQLPVLSDLRRLVESLGLHTPPPPTESRSLVVQQIPEFRPSLLKCDCKALGAAFASRIKSMGVEEQREEMRGLAEMYDDIDLEQFMEDPKCCVCGKPAEKRCSRCKLDWYCGRKCQVSAWPKHKTLCDALCMAAKTKSCEPSTRTSAQTQSEEREGAQRPSREQDTGKADLLGTNVGFDVEHKSKAEQKPQDEASAAKAQQSPQQPLATQCKAEAKKEPKIQVLDDGNENNYCDDSGVLKSKQAQQVMGVGGGQTLTTMGGEQAVPKKTLELDELD